MRLVSVSFCEMEVLLLKGFFSALKMALQMERPFTRWAPHSGLMTSQGTPQTFSV